MRTLTLAALSILLAAPAAAVWDCEVTLYGRADPGSNPSYHMLVDGTYSGVASVSLRGSSDGGGTHGSATAVTAEGLRHTDHDFGSIGRLDFGRDYNPNWFAPNYFDTFPWLGGLDLSNTNGVTVEYHGQGGLFFGVVAPGTPQTGGSLSLSDVYWADVRGRVRLECTRVE